MGRRSIPREMLYILFNIIAHKHLGSAIVIDTAL